MRNAGRFSWVPWALVLVVAGVAGSCNNGLDQRVATLEAKVDSLRDWATAMDPWVDTVHKWVRAAHERIDWPPDFDEPIPPQDPPPKFGG